MISGLDGRRIADAASLLRTRTISATELVQDALVKAENRRDLNAFTLLMREQALADAAEADREIASGRYRGPLHGIPVTVKDLVDVRGTPTTAGSNVPAPLASADAPVVRRLREAGAIVLGKTNLHEFAFGTTSDETAFGAVHNPVDRTRSAGGSSGGSAAAVLTGIGFASVGTDTGGSIRIPAAACGIVGLKPTLGELPCAGVTALSSTLDHVGPLARSVADASLIFQAMKSSSVHGIAPAGGALSFGVPRQYFFDRLDAGVRECVERAIARVVDAGYSVRDTTIAGAEMTPDVYLHICLPEASCYHAASLAEHADRYSPGVRLRLEMGRYLLAEDYVRAMRLRAELTAAVDRALERCEALLLPTMPIPAPKLGATTVDVGGVEAPVRATMLSRTQLFNITGHPAIALPAGKGPEGLPRSLQVVGHRGRTERLLDIAAALEDIIH
jgi:Asp-tRNA(Asn)/Glu-tRNA(Gln) amidotransferase A subunit family amidase